MHNKQNAFEADKKKRNGAQTRGKKLWRVFTDTMVGVWWVV